LSVTAPPANRRVEVVIDFLVPVATVFHSASVRGWSGGEEREAYTDFFQADHRPMVESHRGFLHAKW
jgi:hypothetical protein